MNKELSALVDPLEPTDELIKLNKHYQKLEDLYARYEAIEAILYDLDNDVDVTCMNREFQDFAKKHSSLHIDTELAKVKKAMDAISHSSTLTSLKAKEIFAFQKLGRAISIYKSI